MRCKLLETLSCSVLLSLALVIFSVSSVPTVDEYMQLRDAVQQADTDTLLGGSLMLTDSRELLVNKILMTLKELEYQEGVDSNGKFFAAAQHFFHSKPMIENSNVFKIIKMLPKGAGLHMHDATVGDVQFIALNLTKSDNLYYCLQDWDHLLFRFFNQQPSDGCSPATKWKSVAELRRSASSEAWVDNWFLSSMSMYTPTPEVDYPDTNIAWNFFEKKITTISGVINYVEALKENYYQILQQHYDDNVMYLEMRGLLQDVYHLNQSTLTSLEVLRAYKETTDQFLEDHPDFWGAKYIYAPHRFHAPEVVQELIDNATVMKDTFPDYFAGFDLVGQEDKGTPLLGFLPQLLNATSRGIKFFFHSGETDWHGTKIDENVLDAALLNTTRFAHGYSLYSHPVIYELAKQNGIATEVCPISNQVLRLIQDVRNHPAANYLRNGFPAVVASDGPGMWGAAALSHDWYMAFMAIAGKRADLRFLKQLALNSILYSAMSPDEKVDAMLLWEDQWDTFLNKVIQSYSNVLEHGGDLDMPISNDIY